MTLELAERPTLALLEAARANAAEAGLPYAGGLSPKDAWALVQAGDAVLVDVRTAEERKFVGLVPDSLHVAWATGTSLTRNPRRRAAAVPQRQPLGTGRRGRGESRLHAGLQCSGRL